MQLRIESVDTLSPMQMQQERKKFIQLNKELISSKTNSHSPNLHSKFSTLDVISLTHFLINSVSTIDVCNKFLKQNATAKYV